MASPVAFLFPGQGSQSVGMGKDLVTQFRVAADTFAAADAALGFALSQLCFAGPLDQLTLTANTQPALLTVSVACSRVLSSEFGIEPQWTAGHSLGEFSALVAAGSLAFEDAVRIVRERGRAMQEAVPAGVGTMAAVLGLDAEAVASACEEAAQGQVVSPANFNGAGQIVIAGHREAVQRAGELAAARGAKRVLPLPVSAPFHCALMQPAADRLQSVLATVEIRTPRCPVISNVEARPHGEPDSIRALLVRQMVAPVRWQESVEDLARRGCTAALEVGPGKVLAGLVKRIAPAIRITGTDDMTAVPAWLAST